MPKQNWLQFKAASSVPAMLLVACAGDEGAIPLDPIWQPLDNRRRPLAQAVQPRAQPKHGVRRCRLELFGLCRNTVHEWEKWNRRQRVRRREWSAGVRHGRFDRQRGRKYCCGGRFTRHDAHDAGPDERCAARLRREGTIRIRRRDRNPAKPRPLCSAFDQVTTTWADRNQAHRHLHECFDPLDVALRCRGQLREAADARERPLPAR